jgi:hypothetical protein
MEGFAAFVLGLGMMAAAQDAAYAPYRAGRGYYYTVPAAYADTGYRPAYVYAPAPSPLPVMGAVTGGLIGAAGAGAPGLLFGATAGGLIGDAMSMPHVVHVAPAYPAPAYAPAPAARSAESTDQYIRRWQGSMEPAPRR